ncbi:MAG: hypothetical protein K4304_12605 [Propionicimonas sp.]
MTPTDPPNLVPPRETLRKPARIAAITATAGAAIAWPMAVIDLPQSGPMCEQTHCVVFPFTDAAFSPVDYAWMYPAAVGLLSFAALLTIIEPLAPPQRWVAARLASRSAGAGAVIVCTAFALQLFVVQPSILNDQQDGLTFWTQFNPHGGFIALENLGYLLMSFALLGVSRMVPGRTGLRRLVRITGATLGGLGVLLLPIQAAWFAASLEYRYEVTAISLTWTAIVVLSVPLAGCLSSDPRGVRPSAAPASTELAAAD